MAVLTCFVIVLVNPTDSYIERNLFRIESRKVKLHNNNVLIRSKTTLLKSSATFRIGGKQANILFKDSELNLTQSLLKRPLCLCVLLAGQRKQHSSVPQDCLLSDQSKTCLLQDHKQMRNGSLWKHAGLSCDANCHTCIIQRQVNKRGASRVLALYQLSH